MDSTGQSDAKPESKLNRQFIEVVTLLVAYLYFAVTSFHYLIQNHGGDGLSNVTYFCGLFVSILCLSMFGLTSTHRYIFKVTSTLSYMMSVLIMVDLRFLIPNYPDWPFLVGFSILILSLAGCWFDVALFFWKQSNIFKPEIQP